MNVATLSAPTAAVLSNGLRVVNFNNPKSLLFVDGTSLPGCEPSRVAALTPEIHENHFLFSVKREGRYSHRNLVPSADFKFKETELVPLVTPDMERELDRLDEDPEVDLILIDWDLMSLIRSTMNHPPRKARAPRPHSPNGPFLIDHFNV